MSSKKSNSIKKLEEFKSQFLEEIDNHIEALYKKKDDLKEAIRKRLQLKKHKRSFLKQLFGSNIKYLLSIPLIYGMLIPGFFLHIALEIYQQTCFRIYGIKRVKASKFFVIDRQHLAYLNWFEKANCIYCGYYNGLMSFGREITSLTELYWCPIKHAQKLEHSHEHYHHFVDYLEGEEYRKKIKELRNLAKDGGKCIPGRIDGKV